MLKNGDLVLTKEYVDSKIKNKIAVYREDYLEFLEDIKGHSAGGKGRDGYCWYIDSEYYDKYETKKSNVYDIDKIVIMTEDFYSEKNILGIYDLLRYTDYGELKKQLEKSSRCEIIYTIMEPMEENDNLLFCKKGKFYFLVKESGTVKRLEDEVKLENESLKILAKSIDKLGKKIEERNPFQEAMTQAIIEKGKELATEDLKNDLKESLNKFIEETYGVLPKKITVENKEIKKDMTGLFHKDFEKICKIVSSDIPLMLVGGAGAGKNHTLEQVAEALNLTFYTTNAVNQDYKLTGFIDANGKYHETEFYKAFKDGGMFFLDEIDGSCPEALIILNGAIANKYFDFPIGRIKAHKDFRIVCAGNTYGTGADMVYVGRNVLDGATLDRFVVLNFDYDEEVEKALSYDIDLYKFIRELRKAVNDSGLRYIVSMRAIINASKLLEIGINKEDILKTVIIKNMQKDDINTIIKKISYSGEWLDSLKKMSDIND